MSYAYMCMNTVGLHPIQLYHIQSFEFNACKVIYLTNNIWVVQNISYIFKPTLSQLKKHQTLMRTSYQIKLQYLIQVNDYVCRYSCIFLSTVVLSPNRPNQNFQYYVGTLVVSHHDFLSNSMKQYWYMHQFLSFIKKIISRSHKRL